MKETDIIVRKLKVQTNSRIEITSCAIINKMAIVQMEKNVK